MTQNHDNYSIDDYMNIRRRTIGCIGGYRKWPNEASSRTCEKYLKKKRKSTIIVARCLV